MNISRREFLLGAAAFAALPPLSALGSISPASVPIRRSEEQQSELIDKWDEATGLVTPQDYKQYLRDGKTRGFKALDALERALDKVIGEAKDTVVSGDVPAVWSVYNMGHIVKTRDSIFSIDLKHRRANEFVPLRRRFGRVLGRQDMLRGPMEPPWHTRRVDDKLKRSWN